MRRTAPAGLSSRPRAPAARRARVRSIFGCLRVDPNSRGFSGFFVAILRVDKKWHEQPGPTKSGEKPAAGALVCAREGVAERKGRQCPPSG